jgi:hypothetical protein
MTLLVGLALSIALSSGWLIVGRPPERALPSCGRLTAAFHDQAQYAANQALCSWR